MWGQCPISDPRLCRQRLERGRCCIGHPCLLSGAWPMAVDTSIKWKGGALQCLSCRSVPSKEHLHRARREWCSYRVMCMTCTVNAQSMFVYPKSKLLHDMCRARLAVNVYGGAAASWGREERAEACDVAIPAVCCLFTDASRRWLNSGPHVCDALQEFRVTCTAVGRILDM